MTDRDFECPVCGVGELLPSGVCDHCNVPGPNHPSTPRPIDSAPGDGRVLLLFVPRHDTWVLGWYYAHIKSWWCGALDQTVEPSHWLPVPPSPYRPTEIIPGIFV